MNVRWSFLGGVYPVWWTCRKDGALLRGWEVVPALHLLVDFALRHGDWTEGLSILELCHIFLRDPVSHEWSCGASGGVDERGWYYDMSIHETIYSWNFPWVVTGGRILTWAPLPLPTGLMPGFNHSQKLCPLSPCVLQHTRTSYRCLYFCFHYLIRCPRYSDLMNYLSGNPRSWRIKFW